jgi:hypothetical protein
VAVLVLSDGRSMFKNTVFVPVESKNEVDTEKVMKVMNDEEILKKLREFFFLTCHFSDLTLKQFEIPAEVSEFA